MLPLEHSIMKEASEKLNSSNPSSSQTHSSLDGALSPSLRARGALF